MARTVLLIVGGLMVTTDVFAQSSERDLTVRELQKQAAGMHAQMAALLNRIVTLEGHTLPAQPALAQRDDAPSAVEPTAIRLKGLTITPAVVLESTVLVRTRNETADLATSYSAIPMHGSSN